MAHIRLAEESDLPAILEISNWAAMNTPANFAVEPESIESWREDFRRTSGMFAWLVAADEALAPGEERASTLPPAPSLEGRGSILGFAKASPWKGRCAYLWSAEVTVYVHPDHHGKGIGKALYGRLIEICRGQGYRTLLGGITQPNEASVRLHESFGFRRVALFERIGWKFEKWHDVGYWQLGLGDPHAPPASIRAVCDVT